MDIIGNKTLRCMWDELADTHGSKTALIFEDSCGNSSELTYAELNAKINQAANLFLGLGVNKGDRVALQIYNSPEFVICWFGLAKIGALMVPVNTQYVYGECEYIIKKCQPKVVVIEAAFLSVYQKLKEDAKVPIEHILVARTDCSDIAGVLHFSTCLDKQLPVLTECRPLSSDDPAEILFTSGTTSKPKGAVITHCNFQFAGYFTGWQGSFTAEDRLLTMMPGFHIDFQCNAVMPTFRAGATLIVLEKYSARKFWQQIINYKATLTQAVPLMVRTLMLQPQTIWEKNHCLRDILFGLSLSDKEKDAFEKRFNVTLLNSYGMTESLVGSITECPGERRKWPSVGRPGLGYEAKIIDEDGHELPPNTIGEIYLKGVPGRSILKSYYNDPEATARTISPDGWMHTGDKGYVDESGLFYFVDRKVNMIKRSGENISSTEIENILVCHPKIAEAAVIGVPDEMRDEAVKAFIIFKEGESLTEQEILDYCCEHMAKFKVPSFIEVRTSFPRTCTGKVQKKDLRSL